MLGETDRLGKSANQKLAETLAVARKQFLSVSFQSKISLGLLVQPSAPCLAIIAETLAGDGV